VPRIVPPQDAMQILLKGEALNLEKAKTLKLIDAIVPASDLIKAAKDWIKAGGKAVAPWTRRASNCDVIRADADVCVSETNRSIVLRR